MSYHTQLTNTSSSPTIYGDYHHQPKESAHRSTLPGPLLVPREIPEEWKVCCSELVTGVFKCPLGDCDERFPLGILHWWYIHIFYKHFDDLKKEATNAADSQSAPQTRQPYHQTSTNLAMPSARNNNISGVIIPDVYWRLYMRRVCTLPQEELFPADAWVSCWMCKFRFLNYRALLGHFMVKGDCYGGGFFSSQMVLDSRLGDGMNGGVEVPVRVEDEGTVIDEPKQLTTRSSLPGPLSVPREIPEEWKVRCSELVTGVFKCPLGDCNKRFPLGIPYWWCIHLFYSHFDELKKEVTGAPNLEIAFKHLQSCRDILTDGGTPIKKKVMMGTIATSVCWRLYMRHVYTLPQEKSFPVDAWVSCWMCDFKFSNYKTLLGHFNRDGYCHGGGPLGL